MRIARLVGIVATISLALTLSWAGDVPRSARLAKDSGNQFLSAKKYAGAIDWYFEALKLHPRYPEAHYNLGLAFLKGYKAMGPALHHFEMYLRLTPDAQDRKSVEALVTALRERAAPMPAEAGIVVRVVAGRLLVSGGDWVEPGDRIDVAEKGQDPCACLLADYVYPGCVLTQRIWDEETLERMKPGLVAVNTSEGFPGR